MQTAKINAPIPPISIHRRGEGAGTGIARGGIGPKPAGGNEGMGGGIDMSRLCFHEKSWIAGTGKDYCKTSFHGR
jgi:hypothetical protein